MKGITIGYTRVSSVEQNTDRQLEGIQTDKVFTDKISGKNINRPALEELMLFAREGDTVVVHSMDRLARNLVDLRQTVHFFTNKGVNVQFIKENLTFAGDDDPISVLMLSVMGAFAEFERSLIRSRQKEGIALAKKKGVYKGGKPRLTNDQINSLREQVASGIPKTKVAQNFGITRHTVYNYLKAEKKGD